MKTQLSQSEELDIISESLINYITFHQTDSYISAYNEWIRNCYRKQIHYKENEKWVIQFIKDFQHRNSQSKKLLEMVLREKMGGTSSDKND